jgi:very-short-patch-repair endonuclease
MTNPEHSRDGETPREIKHEERGATNATSANLLGLLEYIEQVEKLWTRPTFTIPDEFFIAHQHELSALPELQFNIQSEGDDVWIRFPRLQEIAPPPLDALLGAWVILPKSPEKTPELRSVVITHGENREESRVEQADHPEIKGYFDWYLKNQWEPWAAAERQRRKAIAVYNRLFSLQQAIASEGVDTPLELVCGIGYSVWKKDGFAKAVKYPLLVQSCDLTINESNFDLEIRPRDTDARLEIDCYSEMELSGVRQLESFWKSSLATGANRVNPFEASTFDGTLKAAVGHLDPSGRYEERAVDAALPTPDDKLRVTNSWVIFGRKRSADIFIEDIRRLKIKIQGGAEIPPVIRKFVEHGESSVRVQPEQAFRGLSTSDAGANALELYFPMPYNEEQVSIIQKLHANDGVVVQGPPGTGKTHTIANVICHYLAQGKRVLVTAKSETALAVLQEKLPDGIRPLSVALLSDDRDGMKQFEHSIQTIASRVASILPSRSDSRIAAGESELSQLHAKISHVDQTIGVFAAKHMENYQFQGKSLTPDELARLVIQQCDENQWFDDEPPISSDPLLLVDEKAITSLRRARMAVGRDLPYVGCSLPAPGDLPPWADLLSLYQDLVRANSIEIGITQGAVFPLVDSLPQTFEKTKEVLSFLNARAALLSEAKKAAETWIVKLRQHFGRLHSTDATVQALLELCSDIRKLETERRQLVAQAIQLPMDAELDEAFSDALARLIIGKSAFALPIGKSDARKLLAKVRIGGSKPQSADEWSAIHKLVTWRLSTRRTLARWMSVSGEFGLGMPGDGVESALRELAAWQEKIEQAWKLTNDFDRVLQARLIEVFGTNVADWMSESDEAFLLKAHASIQAHVDKGRLAYAQRKTQEISGKLDNHRGKVVDKLRHFITTSLRDPAANEAALQSSYQELRSELSSLIGLLPALHEIKRVTANLEKAGAVRWAKRLREIPASLDLDLLTPANWLNSWYWRQAMMHLEAIDQHQKLRKLFAERRTLTSLLAKTYQELIADKTWLAVFNNSPEAVRQALEAYLGAVQKMGSGTGLRAVRYRKDARAAMERAYRAVPCWILPQWRVSEAIPAEVGLFDLVVIDEASQSDIWALPSLLRGKKVLIVGDHKQVSPSAVGMAEVKIKELQSRFLSGQPHGAEMTPEKSIYDLARVVFAGNSVMLKEHFRCVPAIIEYSNREFYQNDIQPLRVPKATERLDPPLVDVFVKGGYREGDVNPVEAKAIVNEIETIIADPAFAGRSIGVVTLLGMEQAAVIHELVNRKISPAEIVGRKISIGPPPVFQGRERDIMLISMVLAPGSRAAANKADMQQRFNVALSRARDRMYLFRSVTENEFSEDSLNGRAIRHFKQPFRQDDRRVGALRERCESGFEIEMFDELSKRGFRVTPQVPCAGRHIDLVVEGNEGRRLAIECDGDRFHGPGQWQDDMIRQRVLERAGWTFWRCFASSFVRRRQAVIDDLMKTLDEMAIQPIGSESVDNTMWVHHKEVDPFDVEKEEQVA